MKIKINIYQEVHSGRVNGKNSSDGYLLVSCSYSGKRMKMHLGINIDPMYWDSENQSVIDMHPDSKVLNDYLKKIREISHQSFLSLSKGNAIPAPLALREKIKMLRPFAFHDFFDAFIEFLSGNRRKWEKSTYKKVRTLYHLLREYSLLPENSLHLYSFDLNDFRKIENHFIVNSGYALSTSLGYLNIIKWFLYWAISKKYYYNPAIRELKPASILEADNTREIIFLKRDELFQIFNIRGLPKREGHIRDIFCFMCFTGLNYSVVGRIKKDDINGERVRIKGANNGKIVPFNRYAYEIVLKYKNKYFRGDNFFPAFSIITINKYIRLIALKSDIQRLVYYKGNKNKEGLNVPLHKVISVGIAKHTFLMTALDLGVSEETILRITGNKSAIILDRYRSQLEVKDRQEMCKFDSF